MSCRFVTLKLAQNVRFAQTQEFREKVTKRWPLAVHTRILVIDFECTFSDFSHFGGATEILEGLII